MFLDNPYLENTLHRHPKPRHPDYEMKSWWSEFVFREKQRKVDELRRSSGRLASFAQWAQKILSRSGGEAEDDQKRPLEEAAGRDALLAVQRRCACSGPGVDTTTLRNVDRFLLTHAKILEQKKANPNGWAASSTEARQG